MADVKITVKDERTIEIPIGVEKEVLNSVADFIEAAANDGYKLNDIRTIQGGSQRDPITVGVRLNFLRQR